MKPKKSENSSQQQDLFLTKLEVILNPQHQLFQLANWINWNWLETKLGAAYVEEIGRPGLPTRLMAGLHYLRFMHNVSDEVAINTFLENPYWQYFCGFEYFQHSFPCHPTSLIKWRKKINVNGIEELLEESIHVAKRVKILKDSDLQKVNVDTTVQEKAVAFPTDSRLYHKSRKTLVREAKRQGIDLRQTYARMSKLSLIKQARYAHAGQMNRARRETKKLKVFLGRVIRDLKRKVTNPDLKLKQMLEIAERIFHQKREDKNKIYSMHAPEVECIAKGKAHKKYEFGCKVSVVTTSKKGFVVGIDALHSNPYDGATLKPSIEQVVKLTGVQPAQIFVDQGYRGKNHHPEGSSVFISGRRLKPRGLHKLLKRRSAIEPVIGHMKQENRLNRNYLLGAEGDRMNAMLSGCAWNLRLIMRSIFLRLNLGLEKFINIEFWRLLWLAEV